MRFTSFSLALPLLLGLAVLPNENGNGLVSARRPKKPRVPELDEDGVPLPFDETDEDMEEEDDDFDYDPYDVVPDKDEKDDVVVMPEMGADKTEHKFDADVGRVMDIVVNSLYQNKDVFLRELISNASDALDKIRFASLTDKEALGETTDMDIKISFDKDAGTITIRDTGVGMTREEMITNLGTVAKSGTKSFVNAASGESSSSADLANQIGQFGVGFYSVFLVSQKVQVASKSNDGEQYVWQSDAKGNFSTSKDPRGNTLGRGSEIILYLKNADKDEFLSEYALERIIKRYSEFITFPIFLEKSRTENIEIPIDVDLDDEADEQDPDEINDKKKKTKTETITIKDFERVNHDKAIWARDKSDITDEAYKQFYQTLSKGQNEAYRWIHFDAEGSINFKSILYLPSRITPEMQQPTYDTEEAGLKLYVRNVLISDKFNELLPRWMNFIKGVVDSDDLKLNVNRETLQGNKIITSIGKKCQKKVLELMKKLAAEKKPEDADDDWVHPYDTFWENFGQHVKMGAQEDHMAQKKLMKLVRFRSTKSDGKLMSLTDYVGRKKDFQDKIYYVAGLTMEEVENSPFLEKAKKKDLEVLLLTDPVDEYLINSVHEGFDDMKFAILTKEGLKFPDDDEDEMDRRSSVYRKMYKKLVSYLKKTYGKKVAKVTISSVLEESPAAFSTAMYGETPTMLRIQRAQAFHSGAPEATYRASSKVLELNPRHPFITKFLEIIESNEDGSKDDLARDTAWALYDSCGLQSGYEIEDVEAYSSRMNRIMQRILQVDSMELDEEITEFPEEEEEEVDEMDFDEDTPNPMDGFDMDGLDMDGIDMSNFNMGDMGDDGGPEITLGGDEL